VVEYLGTTGKLAEATTGPEDDGGQRSIVNFS
jgi:hypothetical protein